ncbi:hypothetical protein HPB48_015506 [Haemaphysalis longicornis]|uniref:Uncharacterized protein n=1 Tax=Haemaphysalis longicornis TaxID=44386 RepID=A0A9J6FKQ9_HAELO|nr:hypothetical protein HPB48_015506 [Haemaphysalis longicornis]
MSSKSRTVANGNLYKFRSSQSALSTGCVKTTTCGRIGRVPVCATRWFGTQRNWADTAAGHSSKVPVATAFPAILESSPPPDEPVLRRALWPHRSRLRTPSRHITRARPGRQGKYKPLGLGVSCQPDCLIRSLSVAAGPQLPSFPPFVLVSLRTFFSRMYFRTPGRRSFVSMSIPT